MLALSSLRPVALSIHIVLGAMFAAALGSHNNAEFNQLEDRSVQRLVKLEFNLFSGPPSVYSLCRIKTTLLVEE